MKHACGMLCCVYLTFGLNGVAAPVADQDRSPVDIGSRLELFVDDFLVDELTGAAVRRLHSPAVREVVHVLDQPWEGDTSAYLSACRDGERILLYYNATPRRQRQAPAVIESRDGIHFSRPDLGLVKFEGSTTNNLLVRQGAAGHNFTPFKDPNPDAPPDQRFKAIAYYTSGGGIAAFVSPDGIHWEMLGDKPIVTSLAEDGTRQGAFDSQNVAFWDPVREIYVCYYRGPDPRGVSRGIWRSTSKDFAVWSKPSPITYSDEHLWHLYTNGIRSYDRAPHLYLGLPNRFVPGRKKVGSHPNRGINDVVLMSSRDGMRFDRWTEAFIRPGPEPEMWTDRNTYPAWGMVQTAPEELSIYWTEHYRHPGMRIRRGTLRTDGFVSVHADAVGGEMLTRPLIFSGDRLIINYATSAMGEICLELADEQGTPLSGFSLGDSGALFGNAIEHIVTWRGRSDLGELQGRPIRLRVRLQDADLYSIRFEAANAVRERLLAVQCAAEKIVSEDAAGFERSRLEAVHERHRQLVQCLEEAEAPAQEAIEAAERLARALTQYRNVQDTAERADATLAAAGEALAVKAGVGVAAYRSAVALVQERLVAAVGDAGTPTEQVAVLTQRLQGALDDDALMQAAHAAARETLAAATEAVREPLAGFGALYQSEIKRRSDMLRVLLSGRNATLATVRRATDAVASAIADAGALDVFPPVRPVAVAGSPAVHSMTVGNNWGGGLRVNLKTDGDDLVLNNEVALRFAGEGDYAECPVGLDLKPDVVTLEAWVMIEDAHLHWHPWIVLGASFEAMLAEPRPDWSVHAYSLWARGVLAQFTLGSPEDEDGARIRTPTRGPPISAGTWQHVAGQFDGRAARLFVNGVEAAAAEYDGKIDYSHADALRIGGKTGHYQWFVGRLRDVRVWNTVRTEHELRDSMHTELVGDEPGLVGWWIAGENSGTGDQLHDLTSGGNHGKIEGAAWVLTPGYCLSSPVAFPDIANAMHSQIDWQTEIQGDAAQATVKVQVGLSDSADQLPVEWLSAVAGSEIPGVTRGDDLSGKQCWVKMELARFDPGTRIRVRRLTLQVE